MDTQAVATDASRPFSPAVGSVDEDIVDPREIDKVLTEVAGMAGRWALFRRFLFERLADDPVSAPSTPTPDADGAALDATPAPQATDGNGAAGETKVPPEFEAVEKSECKKLIEDLLDTYYTPLEVWYTRTIIDKVCFRRSPLNFTQLM
jgi:conserved oligomeric Golgi complex subunit 4